MAANNISVDTNRDTARRLMEVINNLRTTNEKLPEVKAIMDSYVDGTDYTKLEAAMNLSAGQGASLWYLVGGAKDALAASAVLQQLASWVTPQV